MHNEYSRILTASIATALVTLASPVRGQNSQQEQTTSRAAVLDAAREAMVAQSSPPTRSRTDRRLYLVRQPVTSWRS